MPENLHLVTELAIILVAAGIFTIISKALKQPPILGYIIAGFLVGPHLGLFPQFGADSIKEWSELGIIFLLFGLGLEFSFKKLLKIGSSALITAGVTCLGMFLVGMTMARLIGWTSMEGVFLGGLLGMSSTTIIIKSYTDLNLKEKPYAPLIFGALVFEDLIAILLMVLLSALAVTGKFEGKEMLLGIVKLVFFLILWFLVGIYFIPLVLKKAGKYLTDEIMMLVGIGLCFLMVVLANLAGFSSALGAFVMGSILAETTEGQRIEKLTIQVKDLFGAIFFVSVGMMVDPAVIAQHWKIVLAVTIVAVSGILIFSTLGALLAGQGIDNAVHTGFSMAQIGEFSFILAGLGCSLGVMRDFIYPVVIAASVITTFTTPFMIKLGDPVSSWLYRKLPDKVLKFLNPSKSRHKDSKAEHNEWNRLLKRYFLRIMLYLVPAVAVLILCRTFLPEILGKVLPEGIGAGLRNWIRLVVSLAVMSPFVYGIAVSGSYVRKLSDDLLAKNPANRWPVMALVCLRAIIATFFIVSIIALSFNLEHWTILLLYLLGVALFFFLARTSASRISSLESTFMENFNRKDEMERRNAPVASKVKEIMGGYDVEIRTVRIGSDFEFTGKTLREMPFRKESGINIIKIVRGTHSILIPRGDERIYPGDDLLAVGTSAQLAEFKRIIDENTVRGQDVAEEKFAVEPVTLDADSPFVGSTLRELDMRRNGCMIVSVLGSDGSLSTNPSPDRRLESGDTVWIAGEQASVEWYLK